MGARKTLCFGLLIAATLCSDAARSQTPPAPMPRATLFLLTMMRNDVTLEQYMKGANGRFPQLDADSDGKITSADDELNALMATAAMRMSMVAGLLAADLDGDGTVTVDELRRYFVYQRRANIVRLPNQAVGPDQQTEAAIAEHLKADADKDGKITIAEMIAWANSRQQQMKSSGLLTSHNFNQVSSFDSDSDGAVSRQEFDAAHEAFFRTVDADGNGKISAEELKNYRERFTEAERAEREQRENPALAERKRKLAAEREAQRAACAMPKASAAAKVVLLGGYTADALSNVTLGSQDALIKAGSIAIEPGSEPLYLVVVTHDAMIWQFSGAIDRVERLVLASWTTSKLDGTGIPLAGASGLPADKITALRSNSCISPFVEAPSPDATAKIAELAGKPVGTAIGRATGSISLPSGAPDNNSKAKRVPLYAGRSSASLSGPGAATASAIERLADDLRGSFPGGIIAIDPAAVVSLVSAQPYEVLPREAGLIQLLQKGAMAKNLSGDFLIREKIHFPADMPNLPWTNFLLLKGVPEPDGSPGPMKVFSEETGQLLTKR